MYKYTVFFIISTILAGPSSWGSVYSTEYLWPHNKLTTCFADGDGQDLQNGPLVLKFRKWKKSDKEKVKSWVLSEYSEERTGIHFVGFEDCEDNPVTDVAIFYNQNNKFSSRLFGGLDGIASFGTTLKYHRGFLRGYPMANGYVSISTSGMDKGTVIHEFGHIAGLMHEHEHPDAVINEPYCREAVEQGALVGFEYDPYDSDSVMNYCKLNKKGGKNVGLSERDVLLLKKLYPGTKPISQED